MELMESAEQSGMRKTLACCEYCIYCDSTSRYNDALKYVPAGGSTRIASAIERVCMHRDRPIKTWSVEDFLRNNINQWK